MTATNYTIYWQPGCSSCLKAKELLTHRGIPYRSVNVHAEPAALEHLASLGVKTVPVVERDDAFVMAQNLDELVRFLGGGTERQRLSLDVLVQRLIRILDVALVQTNVLTPQLLDRPLRKGRTVRDLAFHVFAIVEGFLAAAEGGGLDGGAFLQTTGTGCGCPRIGGLWRRYSRAV